MLAGFDRIAADATLWIPATVGTYYLAAAAHRSAGKTPLLNPTLLTIAAIGVLLIVLNVPYASYRQSVSVLQYLLGTAVVALAIPLYRHLDRLRTAVLPVCAALVAGSMTSMLSGLAIAMLFGASTSTLLSMLPKSATAAVSMEIARGIGGAPPLAACLTIFTGILGAVLGPYLLNWSGVTFSPARGVALGTASHGIATARAFTESEIAGCCAGMAMGLNAILTALVTPLVVAMLGLGMWPIP